MDNSVSHNVVNNFFLDAFEWQKWDGYSELTSYHAQFARSNIPGEILIHGKYRAVRYLYDDYLLQTQLAKFVPCSDDDPEQKLPPAFVKCY